MYTKKKCKIYVLSVLLCTFFFSCSSIDFELPQGPQGTNGKSAYEIWKEEVETGHINWPSTQVDLADFLVYIKGEKGDKGKDGMSAYDQWKILI
ncbi:collagen-like protein, partial [Phocaeicola vulgatus]